MKKIFNLQDLMTEQLEDLYHGEIQLLDMIPSVIARTTSPSLKKMLMIYQEQMQENLLHVERAFDILYHTPSYERSEAVHCLSKIADKLMEKSMDAEIRDAAIITAMQHISHYKMAGYGASSNYANLLGFFNVAGLVHKNLENEKVSDRHLAQIAEEFINVRARQPDLL